MFRSATGTLSATLFRLLTDCVIVAHTLRYEGESVLRVKRRPCALNTRGNLGAVLSVPHTAVYCSGMERGGGGTYRRHTGYQFPIQAVKRAWALCQLECLGTRQACKTATVSKPWMLLETANCTTGVQLTPAAAVTISLSSASASHLPCTCLAPYHSNTSAKQQLNTHHANNIDFIGMPP